MAGYRNLKEWRTICRHMIQLLSEQVRQGGGMHKEYLARVYGKLNKDCGRLTDWMIKDSGKQMFDAVIVWKLDRFARNRYDSAHYKAQLRKFYESYAAVWCVRYNKEKWDVLRKTDVHSPAPLRVNGVVMNTDLWYELYGVDRNKMLYLPEDERTYIW